MPLLSSETLARPAGFAGDFGLARCPWQPVAA
jgi:hypothetical protein